jgi:glycine cleavage system transcriptional repressor
MSREYVVISALGADRVGLADDVVAWVEDTGGNIEESKMAVLGGEFAIVILAVGDTAMAERLVGEAENRSEEIGIRIEAKITSAPNVSPTGRPYTVESVSLDSPGIVHAITREIRSMDIAIEELDTGVNAAPWTGAPVFHMKALVILPADVPVAEFRDHLDRLAHERDLDIDVEPFTP